MTFLQLVQFAMARAGVRDELPTTLVGADGMDLDFSRWVADAWYELQLEKKNPPWFFRTALDQTLTINASDDDYAMPAGLTTIDWRTVTIYLTAKTDETPVCYIPYYEWRVGLDTRATQEARPRYITERPDGVIQVWPVPDQEYTLRFDGVNELDELTVDTDEPAGLPEEFHRVIAWDAVVRYALHHEDGSMLQNATQQHRTLYDKLNARQLPPVHLSLGHVYNGQRGYRRY